LAVLTCLALLQSNLLREIERGVPVRAPTTVFIDIQPQQVREFERIVAAHPKAKLREIAPHLRARIVRLGNTPVDEAKVADEVRWTLNRDRGLTYRATRPPQAELSSGSWWPSDYGGPPLISIDAGIAAGYRLTVGDTITLNVLGRDITATIGNLRRDVDFTSGNLEFFFIMSPGLIDKAPHTSVATIEASVDTEAELIATVAEALPNVTAISVGPLIEQLASLMQKIGIAVRIVAGITLLTGLLVLASAVAASQQRRRLQTVLFKVLGARRRDILLVFCTEYLVLGFAAAVLGAGVGTLGAWVLTTAVFDLPWHMAEAPMITVASVGIALVLLVGSVGTARLLATPAAQVLRSPS
jgi:putative ABC transport system permease protein